MSSSCNLGDDGFASAVLDALTSNICVVDSKGLIVAVNRSWNQFGETNAASRNEVGMNYLDVCRNAAGPACEEASEFVEGMQSVIEGKKQLFQMEYPCHSPTELRWFQVRVTPLRLPALGFNTRKMSAVVSHMNITDRIRVEQELAKLAATDPLTGLPNRRFFEEVANAELHQVQRFSKRASLLMMDIDRFKSINDTYGHAAGDDVLRAVASLSKRVVRRDDLFLDLGEKSLYVLCVELINGVLVR